MRRRELDDAVRIIGYDELYLLGYRDSGMPDTEANARPDNFANADLDEAVGRLVEIIRRERPQVIVGYGARPRATRTPTTCGCTRSRVLAFERAGDPDWYPELGEPWQPLKLYYSNGFTRAAHPRRCTTGSWRRATRARSRSGSSTWTSRDGRGRRPERRRARRLARAGATTHASTSATRSRSAAPRCSRTAPRSRPTASSSACPLEVEQELHPWEEYVLARSLVDPGTADGDYETDLFAGLRVVASS